jgi:hypothetical protein
MFHRRRRRGLLLRFLPIGVRPRHRDRAYAGYWYDGTHDIMLPILYWLSHMTIKR